MDEAPDEPGSAGQPAEPLRWAQGGRQVALHAGFLVYPFVAALGVEQYSTGASAVAGYLIDAGYCACFLLAFVSGAQLSGRRFWLVLSALTVLSIAEAPFARAAAFFLYAVVVSLAVARLRHDVAAIVTASAIVALLVPWAVPMWHSGPGWIEALTIVFTALITYAFSETVLANRALLGARAEIAQLASEAERNRIARDLHDLLGHSLTAITVKAGLARRLAAADPSRSLHEIAEVENLSRQALADVRAAVSNYRDVTLAGELARGRELLRAVGVTADLPTAADVVDMAHQELFGWAVREGITNVARHAHATMCTVALSAAEVSICDDGVGDPAPDGNGLAGLRERATAAGGSLEAGPLTPHGWRLRVTLYPLDTTPT